MRKYDRESRVYQLKTEIDWLVLRILDRRDMPEEIADGIADCGMTGSDYYEESEKKLESFGEFTFSRKSDDPTRLVLAGPEDVFSCTEDICGNPISTELPVLTRKKLREVLNWRKKDIIIRRTNGKTETAGIYRKEPFTDIAESGETLKINDQKVFETLFISSPRFYVRPESTQDAEKRQKIQDLYSILRATFDQQQNPRVIVKMNVPRSQVDRVCQMLSSGVSPTILPQLKDGWAVIEVLILRKELLNMAGDLERLGVRDIVKIDPMGVL